MGKIKYIGMSLLILGFIFMESSPIYGADEIVELQEGEELMLPDHGQIQIKDETVLCTGKDGNLEAVEEGETEVVISYKIRVKKQQEEKQEEKQEEQQKIKVEAEPEKEKEPEYVEESEKEESEKEESEEHIEEKTKGKAPQIRMPDLWKFSANKEAVTPQLVIQDTDCDPDMVHVWISGNKIEKRELTFTSRQKEEELWICTETISGDGDYLLTCEASDLAGNKAEEWWSFSVNRSGTGFVCSKEEKGPRISLENLDAVEIISCTLNGVPVSYSWDEGGLGIEEQDLKEGKNRILVTVKDAAGNINDMEPWDFTVPVQEKEEKVENKEEASVKMQKETPIGIIFLVIGSILVFWEKKVCYNGNIKKI